MGVEKAQERSSIKEGEAKQLFQKIKKSHEVILEEEVALTRSFELGYRRWTKSNIQQDAVRFGFRLGIATQHRIEEEKPENENKILLRAMEEGCKKWMKAPTNKNAFFSGFHKGVGTERRIQKKKMEYVGWLFDQVKTNLVNVRDTMEENADTKSAVYTSLNSLILSMSSDKAMVATFGGGSEAKKEERDSARKVLTKSMFSGYDGWNKGTMSAMSAIEDLAEYDDEEAEELAANIEDEIERMMPGAGVPLVNIIADGATEEELRAERQKVQKEAYKTGFDLGVNTEREIDEKKISGMVSLFGQIVSGMEGVKEKAEGDNDTKSVAYALLKILVKNSKESLPFDEWEKKETLQKRN